MKTLKVTNGIVKGKTKNILGKEIVEFLCIPYCKPPVNELRFKRPQPCDNSPNDVINKLRFETCFPQLHLPLKGDKHEEFEDYDSIDKQHEDSLYVNIWCPLDILEGRTKSSVFVWIHGGGFFNGSSSFNIYQGDVLAAHENIIVVSLNYRLGMLGFICLDELGINGNLAIWDQVFALRWIHENISVFNGDPENVTLAGNSVGGLSVSLHLIIEESWPYFQKAIIMSGVCFSDWGVHSKEEMVSRSVSVINKILDKFQFPLKWQKNLSIEDKQSIVQFLQGLDFNEFLINYKVVEGFLQLPWIPCCDGELIKTHPRTMVEKGNFKKCPTIILNAANEGYFFLCLFLHHLKIRDDRMVDIKYFNECLQYYPSLPNICKDSIKVKIKQEYNLATDVLPVKALDKIISDQHFVCDAIDFARVISKFNRNVYYLWHKNFSPVPYLEKDRGSYHTSEIFYLFGHPLKSNCASHDSYAVHSKTFMGQIGKFAKQGHLDESLLCFDEKSKAFIVIDETGWHKKSFSEDEMKKVDFWANLRHHA